MTTIFLASGFTSLMALNSGSYAQSTNTPAEDLNVLTGVANPRRMLPDSLNKAALQLLAERERSVARLSTREEVEGRRRFIREKILQAIDGLPERAPLNPRLTGTLKRNGYRIEKIIFESQPAFYVTAKRFFTFTKTAKRSRRMWAARSKSWRGAGPSCWRLTCAAKARRAKSPNVCGTTSVISTAR